MKSQFRIYLPILVLSFGHLHSEELQSETTVGTAAGSPTTARILGSIPDGTPPPPAAPKPEFVIPAGDIIQTTTRQQGGRQITIRKIKPIALPPPPIPVASAPAPLNAEFAERLAEYRANQPQSSLLALGATVYNSEGSPPRSLVHYWPPGSGESITFWSSADFTLISGIQSFVDTNGNTHGLFLMCSSIDMERVNSKHRKFSTEIANIPAFSDGPATFEIASGQATASDLLPIQSLHDLYNSERHRLETAQQGREQARIQREADLKANPPQPKDITLNFWRTEKPATNGNGGDK
jgi:hypothetical protein